MTKLEKVLKGLECCKTDPYFESDCEDKECPYKTDLIHCINYLCTDALELLKARELTKEEWKAWKKSPRRDPICMVYYQDTTPIWVLDPTAVNEVSYYMGRIKLFTKKPGREAVKWG